MISHFAPSIRVLYILKPKLLIYPILVQLLKGLRKLTKFSFVHITHCQSPSQIDYLFLLCNIRSNFWTPLKWALKYY